MYFQFYFFVKQGGQKVHCPNAKEVIMNNGQIVKAQIHGKMEENTLENLKMARDTDKEL